MRLFTAEQHKEILTAAEADSEAAGVYSARCGKTISRELVRYWRRVFLDNDGKLAKADRELKESRTLRKPDPDEDIGNFLPERTYERILVIPDLHAPYQHKDALRFLKAVKAEFDPDLVVCLGDELDYHAMSFHDSDPNLDSAGVELERGKAFLAKLYREFPTLLMCHSNHGSMQFRRAKAHGLPVQLIKSYREVIFPQHGAPGWSWAYQWKVSTPLGPVLFKHQASGSIIADAAHNGANLIVGHSHGQFGVEYSASSAHLYYGAYAGCLIDKDSLAFAYGKHSLRKPIIGCIVVLDGKPVPVPMVLDKAGRWIGRL